MAASEHIQPYQLRLYMTADELMNIRAHDSSKGTSLKDDPEMYQYKLAESKPSRRPRAAQNESLYESIAREGVKTPVRIWAYRINKNSGWNELLVNGHHRVASANDIDPQMWIPVEYTEED